MRGWIICFQNPVISGSCYLFSSTHIHQQVSTKLTLNGHCATFVAIKFAGANSNVTHKAAERLSLGCFGRVDQGSSQVTQTHIKSSFDTQLFGYMIYIYMVYAGLWQSVLTAKEIAFFIGSKSIHQPVILHRVVAYRKGRTLTSSRLAVWDTKSADCIPCMMLPIEKRYAPKV